MHEAVEEAWREKGPKNKVAEGIEENSVKSLPGPEPTGQGGEEKRAEEECELRLRRENRKKFLADLEKADMMNSDEELEDSQDHQSNPDGTQEVDNLSDRNFRE